VKKYFVRPSVHHKKYFLCRDCGRPILNRLKSAIYCRGCAEERVRIMQRGSLKAGRRKYTSAWIDKKRENQGVTYGSTKRYVRMSNTEAAIKTYGI